MYLKLSIELVFGNDRRVYYCQASKSNYSVEQIKTNSDAIERTMNSTKPIRLYGAIHLKLLMELMLDIILCTLLVCEK